MERETAELLIDLRNFRSRVRMDAEEAESQIRLYEREEGVQLC